MKCSKCIKEMKKIDRYEGYNSDKNILRRLNIEEPYLEYHKPQPLSLYLTEKEMTKQQLVDGVRILHCEYEGAIMCWNRDVQLMIYLLDLIPPKKIFRQFHRFLERVQGEILQQKMLKETSK